MTPYNGVMKLIFYKLGQLLFEKGQISGVNIRNLYTL